MGSVLLSLILGLVLLLFSGEFLVRGGVSLARHFKVSSLVIGVTVVSFGTSAPELVVSLDAALTGHPAISIGNVIGSNISNIALILSIPVHRDSIRIDWPIMMLASLLFLLFILNDRIDFYEGLLFVLLLVTFITWSLLRSRKQNRENKEEFPRNGMPLWGSLLMIAVSSAGLVIGANQLVKGASGVAQALHVSEHAISVSVVALGTSLPELATSLVAAIRKEMDISVGNIIGSNIFNLFGILGLTATIKPIPVSEGTLPDVIWMLGISLLLFLFMLPRHKAVIQRWKGIILLASYCTYIYFVFVN